MAAARKRVTATLAATAEDQRRCPSGSSGPVMPWLRSV